METLWYAIAAVLVVIGIVGTILPALPGVPLVFAGMLLAAWAGGFEHVGWMVLGVLGVLTAVSVVVDFWATAVGARRVGASGKALAGSILGTFVGIPFGIAGLFAGPFVGALAGELLHQRRAGLRDVGMAARVGVGTWVGIALGVALKLALVFAMLGLFALAWLF